MKLCKLASNYIRNSFQEQLFQENLISRFWARFSKIRVFPEFRTFFNYFSFQTNKIRLICYTTTFYLAKSKNRTKSCFIYFLMNILFREKLDNSGTFWKVMAWSKLCFARKLYITLQGIILERFNIPEGLVQKLWRGGGTMCPHSGFAGAKNRVNGLIGLTLIMLG